MNGSSEINTSVLTGMINTLVLICQAVKSTLLMDLMDSAGVGRGWSRACISKILMALTSHLITLLDSITIVKPKSNQY
jgi:hypothetical protein